MNGEVVSCEWDISTVSENRNFAGFAEDERGTSITDYRDLDVWKEGMALAISVYRDTAGFPREELYGLVSQMRRASVSISTNIAEGYGRETTGAFIQFLRIAQGSLKELETLVELSRQLEFLNAEKAVTLKSDTVRLSKMLRAFIRALERRNAQ